MELILLGDLFIFVGGFRFGSLWQKSRRTKRAVDGATVCPNCGNEQMGAFGCCACGYDTPRN